MSDEPKFHGQENKDAHALAIGKIAMGWNEFHETLGELFARLFTKSHHATALAIWHCLDSDRTQRRLLRAMAETQLQWNKRGLEELIWLLNQTDQMLSQQRNVGIHAPLMSFTEADGTHKMLPLSHFGNRNAAQIEGRDILLEYGHYEKQIRQIGGFAFALTFKLTMGKDNTDDTWPQRPKLSGRPT
ncbi:hypothetical protein BjapCC829_24735 [Bradyrhizobium barranii]|uniref:Uncharacterized protein n=1 Tax=Bradyrhizobium barranii TaxID=2992140 RepID=A0ABY3QC22_9BRAD|nr:hypothetical protein [Bradyrhizobium japonicum]UFW83184.1 hypothetical protein BjapCC829_24735 [Bradyrhizobium japonicum]